MSAPGRGVWRCSGPQVVALTGNTRRSSGGRIDGVGRDATGARGDWGCGERATPLSRGHAVAHPRGDKHCVLRWVWPRGTKGGTRRRAPSVGPRDAPADRRTRSRRETNVPPPGPCRAGLRLAAVAAARLRRPWEGQRASQRRSGALRRDEAEAPDGHPRGTRREPRRPGAGVLGPPRPRQKHADRDDWPGNLARAGTPANGPRHPPLSPPCHPTVPAAAPLSLRPSPDNDHAPVRGSEKARARHLPEPCSAARTSADPRDRGHPASPRVFRTPLFHVEQSRHR